MSRQWLSLIGVFCGCIATVISADIALSRIHPLQWSRQVDDGVRDLRNGNPRILSISSSYGRTMDAVGAELARRTGEPGSMVSITMQGGKATHFRAVLQERLQELIDERSVSGELVRNQLSQVLLVTVWWDSCEWEDESEIINPTRLPAHVWTFTHFMSDVFRNGLTPYNRNYVHWHTKYLLRDSVLVLDRGEEGIVTSVLVWAGLTTPGRTAEAEREFTNWWLAYHEGGAKCIFDASQMHAYDEIVDFVKSRGLDLTLVVFPQRPSTVTDKAMRETLVPFVDGMRAYAARNGVGFIDLSLRSPLVDDDFMADYDHVNPAGNEKFSNWVLNGPLSFLVDTSKSLEQSKDSMAGASP